MEGKWTQLDAYENDNFRQALIMDFTVGGVAWPDDTLIMIWVSFKEFDPEDEEDNEDESERILSFTCTTQYSQQSIFSTYHEVLNYYGPNSFSVKDTGTDIEHDEVNKDDLVDLELEVNKVRDWWLADD